MFARPCFTKVFGNQKCFASMWQECLSEDCFSRLKKYLARVSHKSVARMSTRVFHTGAAQEPNFQERPFCQCSQYLIIFSLSQFALQPFRQSDSQETPLRALLQGYLGVLLSHMTVRRSNNLIPKYLYGTKFQSLLISGTFCGFEPEIQLLQSRLLTQSLEQVLQTPLTCRSLRY